MSPHPQHSHHLASVRAIALPIVAVLAAILFAPSGASAAVDAFSNSTQITIPAQGPASPNPSPIMVSGLRGPVVDVEFVLNGVTHTRPQDLDVMVIAPNGIRAPLMSDACGTGDVANYTWVFKSNGNSPFMGDTCPEFYYRQTDIDSGPDVWPGSGFLHPLNSFHRKALNGQWNLYVTDDTNGDSGRIARGWSLRLTTLDVNTLIPGTGTFGLADPYPSTRTVADTGQVVTDVNVRLNGPAHDRPDDIDLLLVGPRGQKVMLMSDACGDAQLDQGAVQIDDEAAAPFPDGADPMACRLNVKPADYEPGDRLPAPAPDGPYATSLSEFDLTDPAGDWRLYANDDADGAEGYFYGQFDLLLETRPKATVEFTEGAVEVPEGTTRVVTITRTAPGALGAGAVTVRSTPVSATSGTDFTPVDMTVQFAPGEREKTVLLDAVTDGAAEPAETYSVALSAATGDAAVGTQSMLIAMIPASEADPRPGDPRPQIVQRCAGLEATIVGTAGADVLRGTPAADVIVALGGNDVVTGARGNDVVCAGAGNDRLSGEGGRDRLRGGPGNDRLRGGRGRDTCLGGKGRDRASCERKISA